MRCAPGLLDPALPLGLGLFAHPVLHRVASAPGLGEDLLRLAARLADQLLVLFEQAARLLARVFRLLEREANLLTARVDHLLNRAERVPLELEERDQEADDRPD